MVTYSSQISLGELKNCHAGRRAFVIGNGPSLRIRDLDHLQDEITFAANKIYLAFDSTHWRPTYYGVEDKLVMVQNYHTIKALKGPVKFLPRYLNRWVAPIPDAVYFDLETVPFYPQRPCFSHNAATRVYWGSTITYTLIQLACFMGIREIFLLGVDHDFKIPDERDPDDPYILISQGERNHFHPDYRKPGEKWFVPNLEMSIKSYESAREGVAAVGGKIYNATRGGKLEVFPRVNFESLF